MVVVLAMRCCGGKITLFPSRLEIEIFTKWPCDFKQKPNKNFSEIWKVYSKIDMEKQRKLFLE